MRQGPTQPYKAGRLPASWRPRHAAFASMALLSVVSLAHAAARDDAAGVEYFEKKVRPLLVANCYTCHSAETNSRSGLRVDDRNGLLVGGGRGPAIIPGKPDESLLIRAVSYTGKLKMPPERRLSDDEVAVLKKWIRDGAAWTKVESLPSQVHVAADYARLRKEHWAWQPLRDPRSPSVGDRAWPRDAIDRFLLARMEERGVTPVGDAEKLSLIRRATFDLTGLPPTLAEIDAFLADRSETAFERVVDRLLASPAFGERWGRHWLDVARYAESTGSARNLPFPHAWRYRDYVIDAFNNDKPYDEFLREQIAGDLLPSRTRQEKTEHLIATGFLALGVKDVNQRFKVRFLMDNIDEQIDTVTRSVLALTASCARCHNHKFDPIPTTDYYALAGIFRSTDMCAALRNKMGGGGLDYYDPQMLLRIGPGTAASSETKVTLARLQDQLKQARADVSQRAAKGRSEVGCRLEPRETVAGRDRPPERSGGEWTGGDGRTRCARGRRHGHSHPRHRRELGTTRPARLSECRPDSRSARGQRPAKRPARTGPMAQQPAESAHFAGHRQPRLASPVWRRAGQIGRQLRGQRRRAVASRVARSPGDAVPSRRLVHQEARAVDRADAGLPDEFERVAGEPGGRSGKPARLASLSAPARRGGDSRRHLGRSRPVGFVASARFASDEFAGHRTDEQRGPGPTADRAGAQAAATAVFICPCCGD